MNASGYRDPERGYDHEAPTIEIRSALRARFVKDAVTFKRFNVVESLQRERQRCS